MGLGPIDNPPFGIICRLNIHAHIPGTKNLVNLLRSSTGISGGFCEGG